MAPRETTLHTGIVQLLLHFQWTWIGLIVSDDDGENFVQTLTPRLTQNDICVAYMPLHAMKLSQRRRILDTENFINMEVHAWEVKSPL